MFVCHRQESGFRGRTAWNIERHLAHPFQSGEGSSFKISITSSFIYLLLLKRMFKCYSNNNLLWSAPAHDIMIVHLKIESRWEYNFHHMGFVHICDLVQLFITRYHSDQKSAGGIPLPNRRLQEFGIFHLMQLVLWNGIKTFLDEKHLILNDN